MPGHLQFVQSILFTKGALPRRLADVSLCHCTGPFYIQYFIVQIMTEMRCSQTETQSHYEE